MTAHSFINLLLGIVLAPLLFGIINRTKAFFAGRRGAPLLQLYFDLFKLLQKGTVYSVTTSLFYRLTPSIYLGAVVVALLFVPLGGTAAVLGLPGDFVLVCYLLALGRFVTVVSALDTGSSFAGMGASREVAFSALGELPLVLTFVVLVLLTGETSLSSICAHLEPQMWRSASPVLLLIASTLFILLLSENGRVPADDPNTHLELTMIHEVMILDYSGPDLAYILYGSALKLWLFGGLFLNMVLPLRTGNVALDAVLFVLGMTVLAVVIGIVESTMARFRFLKVPQMLIAAGALVGTALLLVFGVA